MGVVFFAAQAMAQRTISGKVTDDKGNPLGSVSVLVRGTNTGTTSKADGTYSLSVPANAKALIFSSIDMSTVEVAIGTSNQVNASLKTEDKIMSEVIVTGYGTQKKKELTGSVSSIKASQIKNVPLIGPDQALQGRVAGVTVTQSSGTPGSSINVNIRGTGSISGGTQPLYVIDGIPIVTGSFS